MRTTLTLDDDVAAKLKEEMASSGSSFKETVNQVLRRGLNPADGRAAVKPFVVRGRALEALPGVSYDNIGELLQQIDAPYPPVNFSK